MLAKQVPQPSPLLGSLAPRFAPSTLIMDLAGYTIHLAGSATTSCDPASLERAHQFARALTSEVLKRQGAVLVLATREPRTPQGAPQVFDWIVLEEVLAHASVDASSARATVMSATADHRIPADRQALLQAIRRLPSVTSRYIADDVYTGERIRAVVCELASAIVAVSGGKGVTALSASRSCPLVPVPLGLGASLDDGQGSVGLWREALVHPERYFRHRHADLLNAFPFLDLLNSDPAEAARRTVALICAELADIKTAQERHRPPMSIPEAIVLHESVTQASLDLHRIKPWANLSEKESLYLIDKLGGPEIQEIKRRVELYGLCRIRFAGQEPQQAIIEALARNFGEVLEEQNDYKGAVKDIAPTAGTAATTGDSRGRLGPHADGTQNETPPALLIFQYVRNADFASESTFWDLAHLFLELDPTRRNSVLASLGHPEAGTFGKKGLEFRGPMATLTQQNTVAIRERFDAVVSVHEDVREVHEYLRKRLERPAMVYLPARGDMVIFDNGRILHGREEIGGDAQRLHRRMWIAELRPDLQSELLLGIRPLEPELMAKLPRRG